MTKSIELSCEEFVEALSSKAPAPGGGGAAAFVGAVGAGLGHMVGALTVGKPKYADVEPELLELMLDADDVRAQLLALVEEKCAELGVNAVLSEHWAKGGAGAIDLAHAVVDACEIPSQMTYSYELEGTSIEDKLDAVARKVYHADGVDFVENAPAQLKVLKEQGFGDLPVCVAKTQYSFSDNPALLGAPRDFRISVRNLTVSAGAGFIVALTGDIMTMPGLPKVPAAEKIDVDENGRITGLF